MSLLGDEPRVDELIARAFADRPRALDPKRLASRLRAGARPLAALCLAARRDERLLGALMAWPVRLDDVPLTLIGPVAVEPTWQGSGVGAALMTAACARLTGPAVLVGDPEYYGRWGFAAASTQEWTVDGAVERHRLLARAGDEALPTLGILMAAGGGDRAGSRPLSRSPSSRP